MNHKVKLYSKKYNLPRKSLAVSCLGTIKKYLNHLNENELYNYRFYPCFPGTFLFQDSRQVQHHRQAQSSFFAFGDYP